MKNVIVEVVISFDKIEYAVYNGGKSIKVKTNSGDFLIVKYNTVEEAKRKIKDYSRFLDKNII